jgi:hypothetical protein
VFDPVEMGADLGRKDRFSLGLLYNKTIQIRLQFLGKQIK